MSPNSPIMQSGRVSRAPWKWPIEPHDSDLIESFRFEDAEDYEYETFSILIIAHAWTSVILAGKRDSRQHSTTSFSENDVEAGTSYQM